MFPFDADCSYCGYLLANDVYQGKFYCEKKKEYVSANGHLCSMAIESMGRPNCDKAKLRKISKEHGYYVVTAISEILELPEDNQYLEAFKYLRDVILPTRDEYEDFIADYELDGPVLAARIKGDEDARAYAEYLRVSYLNGLVSLFCQNQIDDAMALY
ncbi:MAG: hypothetical protein K2L98_02225, partial [Bacilli bacterium]|nr:hypothetical protein [Bacilli bacterium]